MTWKSWMQSLRTVTQSRRTMEITRIEENENKKNEEDENNEQDKKDKDIVSRRIGKHESDSDDLRDLIFREESLMRPFHEWVQP